MVRALYGHPDAGTEWERKCDSHCKKVGFVPITDWPSCYVHPRLKLFLVVYVDDFKMVGKSSNLALMWTILKQHIDLEDSTSLEGNVYLGCTQTSSTVFPDLVAEKKGDAFQTYYQSHV